MPYWPNLKRRRRNRGCQMATNPNVKSPCPPTQEEVRALEAAFAKGRRRRQSEDDHFFADLQNGIAHFNRKFAYIVHPGMIVDGNFSVMEPGAFQRHQYSNYYYEDAKGYKDLAKAWLKHSGRHQYQRLAYAPGKERVVNNNELNAWRGWGVS